MLGVSVSEIHGYPLRPEGFEEPLFPTAESRRDTMKHFLRAPWLMRASELKGGAGETARVFEEPIDLGKDRRGRWEVVRLSRSRRRCTWRRRRVLGVLDRWREVRGWWEESEAADRVIFRLLVSGGAVVEVARERSGGWLLVGVVD